MALYCKDTETRMLSFKWKHFKQSIGGTWNNSRPFHGESLGDRIRAAARK